MQIDKNIVVKVADLARIDIKETEIDHVMDDMNKILTFMEKLNELDTTDVAPLVYLNNEVNVWREDVVSHTIDTKEGLKNAAKQNGTFFMVPKIIES